VKIEIKIQLTVILIIKKMGRLIYLILILRFKDREEICKMSRNYTIRVRAEIGFNRINFLKFAKT
jgi:hypothetical protein